MRGNETPGQIVTNFRTGVGVHDVITFANFYDCRLLGFERGGGSKFGFFHWLASSPLQRPYAMCNIMFTHPTATLHRPWQSLRSVSALVMILSRAGDESDSWSVYVVGGGFDGLESGGAAECWRVLSSTRHSLHHRRHPWTVRVSLSSRENWIKTLTASKQRIKQR